MKRIVATVLLAVVTTAQSFATYTDHRGHNVDSLEKVVAPWTANAIEKASTEDLLMLVRAYRNLMLGYNVISPLKSDFYARKALAISIREDWPAASSDALRYIGQHFYTREQYDSAMVYYRRSLGWVDKMAAGATSTTNPEGYDETYVDDYYSALYGAIGNLYNVMDSIPQAMEWYEKAGAIFDKHGWNESNSVLWYNIGETWGEQQEFKKALQAYDKSLKYAQAAGDTLFIMDVYKGYGGIYLMQGKTWKALPYLKEAAAYYEAHPDYAPSFRVENLEFMNQVLAAQKKEIAWMATAAVLLVLLAIGIYFIARRLRLARREQAETALVMDETLSELRETSRNTKLPPLSEREKEILDLLAKGYTTAQTADAIFLSTETVRWYRKKLLAKYGVANTPELVSLLKDSGLL